MTKIEDGGMAPDAWMDEFGEVSTTKPAVNPQPLYLHPPGSTAQSDQALIERLREALRKIESTIGTAIGSGAVNPNTQVFGRSGLADKYATAAFEIARDALAETERSHG